MSTQVDLVRRWIGPVGEDPGCEGSFETFELYVEAVLAGRPADALFPGPALHVEACPDCHEDFVALRELVLAAGEEPSPR